MNDHSFWIGITKYSDDRWYDSIGNEVMQHLMNWAEHEPSNNGGCVVATRQKEYVLKETLN